MTTKPKPDDELRMSAKEFDRIMGQALKVKPETTPKTKRPKARKKGTGTAKTGHAGPQAGR